MKILKNIFGNFGTKSQSLRDGSPHHKPVHNHHHKNNSQHDQGYQCPMECEGDKLYDDPGNCPVCNMKMVSLEDVKQGGHHHGCC